MTIAYLEKLQSRSKHVPLAITYTLEFMKAANEAELSLTLIRFISQLADVSAGVSMASSLHYVLDDSSLLTEIRHSLTHKAKANGEILSMSRRMILD